MHYTVDSNACKRSKTAEASQIHSREKKAKRRFPSDDGIGGGRDKEYRVSIAELHIPSGPIRFGGDDCMYDPKIIVFHAKT